MHNILQGVSQGLYWSRGTQVGNATKMLIKWILVDRGPAA